MYRKSRHDEELPETGLYFEGRLNPENRWVKTAGLVPWTALDVEMVCENPNLQYFHGFKTFQTKPPFSASLMTHFRKRLPKDIVISFNEKVIGPAKEESSPDDDPPPDGGGSPPLDTSSSAEETNSGTILMDATCAPADIKYPTDLNLVNDAR